MSWQQYIDEQLMATKKVDHAVICGHDGNIWAKSDGFNINAAELKSIVSRFNDVDAMSSTGIIVEDTKYIYTSSSESVVRGKKGADGVHAMKTGKTLILCLYRNPHLPEGAAGVTEKLGDFLIQSGF